MLRTPVVHFVVLCCALFLASGAAAQARRNEVPEGLAASDWSSIKAAYEAGRHAAQPVGDGYQARNPGQ